MSNPIAGRGRTRGVGVRFLVAAAVVALLGGAAAARAADPVLTAVVGTNDGFVIGLSDATGSPVKHLDPGTYSILVHDRSTMHNFHLSGPAVDVATGIDFAGDQTFTVTFGDGKFFFQCDPHSAQMKGSFTVGSVTDTPPTPPPAAVARLSASLSAAGAAAIRPASGLSAGTFRITVADRSAKDGFRLLGPGVSKTTGVKFRGTVAWSVSLRAGKYVYGSARNAGRRHTLIVSPA